MYVLARTFVVGSICPISSEIDPAQWGFSLAEVPQDPNGFPYRVIAGMTIECTKPYGSEMRGCDEDDDPYIIEPVIMPEGMTWDGSWWHWTATSEQRGNHFLLFRITDAPIGSTPGTTYAVYLVKVTNRVNHPPVLLPFGDVQ